MRRLATIAALALACFALDGASRPTRAVCANCWTGVCYSNAQCFRGCVCMKQGRNLRGACFSSGYEPPSR